MLNIAIIGTSLVVEEHIKCFKALNMKVIAICTTNPKSTRHLKLKKKYKINHAFSNINELFDKLKSMDFCFFLAPRIKDTEKILLRCLILKKKIFVEKPLSLNLEFYKKIKPYKKLIFVGYNRMFYSSIDYVRKKLKNKKNIFIEAIAIESNKKDILTNSCHLISILLGIFGKIKILKVIRNQFYFFVEACDLKKNFITIRFSFKSSENFQIKIVNKKNLYLFKPLEIMREFSEINRVKVNNQNYYKPKLTHEINENLINRFKPGFYEQCKFFKQFALNKKKNFNSINNAFNIMKICKIIYGYK